MWSYDDVIRLVIPEVEFHQNRYARLLDQFVTDGVDWLDVGAGTKLHNGWIGVTADEQAQRARTLVGCDLEVSHLRANAQLTAGVGADVTRLPFHNEQFDLVTANMVIEHLAQPGIAFAEIARVLKPKGVFAFVTSHLGHPAVRMASLLLSPARRKVWASRVEGRDPKHVFPTFYRANRTVDLERVAADAGLVPRTLEVFPSYPFIRKPTLGVFLESILLRSMRWAPLRQRFGSNLVGVLEKPSGLRA